VTTAVEAGVLLIVLPLAFIAAFADLAAKFDYPEILRKHTQEILQRFRDGGSGLVLLWWSFAMTAVLLAPAAVLLSGALPGADSTLLALGSAAGVLAAVVQFLGLIRWPFLVPYPARTATAPDASAARQEAVDVVFQSFNRYLGVAVGEHLGYLFSGAWSVLAGVAMIQSNAVPAWLGIVGIAVGAVLALCSLEFVGLFEPHGWKLAATLTPVTYVVWSLWLVAVGVVLLF